MSSWTMLSSLWQTPPAQCLTLQAVLQTPDIHPRGHEGRIAGVCFILHLASSGPFFLSFARLLMDAGGKSS